MKYFQSILNYLFQLFLDYTNIYILVLFLVPLIFAIFLKLRKFEKAGSFFTTIYVVSSFTLDYFMFRLGLIDSLLLTLVGLSAIISILFQYSYLNRKKNFFKFGKNYFQKRIFNDLLTPIIGIYALFTIEFFNNVLFLKFTLSLLYLLYIVYLARNFSIHNKYIKKYDTPDIGIEVIDRYPGWRLIGLPFNLLLDIKLYLIFYIIGVLPKIEKTKISQGLFDISNRATLIIFNSDNLWQGALFLIISTLLITRSFDLVSIYYSILLISGWQLLRSRKQLLPKYLTIVTGELFTYREAIYDNLLLRVIPDKKFSLTSKINIANKNITYGIFFNNFRYSYDSQSGFFDNFEILKNAHHSILLFNNNDDKINFICEYTLLTSLSSPMTIIDTWVGDIKLDDYFNVTNSDFYWYRKRLALLQTITDEYYGRIDGSIAKFVNTNDQKILAKNTLLRMNLVNSSSFESLRQNIQLKEIYFNESDLKSLNQLNQKGIFEFSTLYRQLHESPSIPSRFIDLVNISECIVRYLCGFCFAVRNKDGLRINNDLSFDTKSISFGTCVDYLARWKKSDVNSTLSILETRIKNYLDINYIDYENIENLISFLKNLNPNAKVKHTHKPSVIDLLWWMVAIRNKTRGHGTPSKVDYQFYICLEKVTLFLLSEISKLNFAIAIRIKLEDQEWTIDLSKGGLPVIVPNVENLEKNIHLNPMLSNNEFEKYRERQIDILENIPKNDDQLYLKVTQDDNFEWWKCKDYFKVNNGIVYILNQRTDSVESWISFSTGKIMRPEIADL
jgi:hypothetical protein